MLENTMKSSRALLWVALGAALWGTDTLFRRTLTTALESSRIVLYEHLILTVLLLPVCWRGRREWIALRPLQWAAVLDVVDAGAGGWMADQFRCGVASSGSRGHDGCVMGDGRRLALGKCDSSRAVSSKGRFVSDIDRAAYRA